MAQCVGALMRGWEASPDIPVDLYWSAKSGDLILKRQVHLVHKPQHNL